eukprot:TRINITY_DN1021_c1_g1_i1.p1 TRINITY_DN1021_c1_g1~~TRINITY_DN1021_c1_g1_i1.p1  ORF type:complete len:180 (-),score=85.78 TRINITY_DN1021_c1_g1_i1:91-579(-)
MQQQQAQQAQQYYAVAPVDGAMRDVAACYTQLLDTFPFVKAQARVYIKEYEQRFNEKTVSQMQAAQELLKQTSTDMVPAMLTTAATELDQLSARTAALNAMLNAGLAQEEKQEEKRRGMRAAGQAREDEERAEVERQLQADREKVDLQYDETLARLKATYAN